MNTSLEWYAYLHESGTIHVKRVLINYDGITDARMSPFVKKVYGPFWADSRDLAMEVARRELLQGE